jgi:hypothetical protein
MKERGQTYLEGPHGQGYMTPREKELLTGMCNCYAACGDSYENTLWMVARARGLSPENLKSTLVEVSKRNSSDEDYLMLRRRLPSDFPF